MRTSRYLWLAACVAVVLTAAAPSLALTFGDTNLVDLIGKSRSIVAGSVASVTDGIDERGIPYTEVTISVSEAIKGGASGTYTFRQFGLLSPRPVGDGRVMMPAPAGFPRYAVGERVFLFLAPPAKMTGLQTTYALAAGKFTIEPGRAQNDLANEGIFRNVALAAGLPTDNDQRMLATQTGAVNPDTFVSFVRRAVQEDWIGTRKMWKPGSELARRGNTSTDPNNTAPTPGTGTTTVGVTPDGQ